MFFHFRYTCHICGKDCSEERLTDNADLGVCHDCYFNLDKPEWEEFMKKNQTGHFFK